MFGERCRMVRTFRNRATTAYPGSGGRGFFKECNEAERTALYSCRANGASLVQYLPAKLPCQRNPGVGPCTWSGRSRRRRVPITDLRATRPVTGSLVPRVGLRYDRTIDVCEYYVVQRPTSNLLVYTSRAMLPRYHSWNVEKATRDRRNRSWAEGARNSAATWKYNDMRESDTLRKQGDFSVK